MGDYPALIKKQTWILSNKVLRGGDNQKRCFLFLKFMGHRPIDYYSYHCSIEYDECNVVSRGVMSKKCETIEHYKREKKTFTNTSMFSFFGNMPNLASPFARTSVTSSITGFALTLLHCCGYVKCQGGWVHALRELWQYF